MVTLSRRGRSDNWTAALLLRYPLARSVGFECFRGWRPILGRLLERLAGAIAQQPVEAQGEFRIVQIKQKFGRLRVYLSKTATPEMRAAIDEAEEESTVTCEVAAALGCVPSDSTHCGNCTTTCQATEYCFNNTCGSDCSAGTGTVCGGHCSNTLVDVLNCGGCGNDCGVGQTCSNGACVDNTTGTSGAGGSTGAGGG